MRLIKAFFTIILLTTASCDYFKSVPKPIESIIKAAPEKQYVLGTDDIPLLPGLELIEEDSSSFDAMFGNIVISKYLSDIKLRAVKEFYLEALPQLGWKLVDSKVDQISFKREDDKLEIKFNYASKGLYVRFFISSVIQ